MSGGPTEGLVAILAVVPWIVGLLGWIVTILALVDAIRVPRDSDYRAGTKIIWVLVILLLNCVGAIVYYAVGKPRRG
ncbi:MAG: Phospholipase D-nuclease N-terminal [Armatimonadetes bacterium]|jgi:hypothetical protein|nr:Phospholipase D-nuclease N-terminal [Armatimonadota bacterium]